MICCGPFAEVLAECQLLFYTVFNVLTYPSRSPSSDKSVGSRGQFRFLHDDVFYTVAVDEGRVNLKF